MADVIDVVHKINYEVEDSSLQNAAKTIKAQIDELLKLNVLLADYTKQFNTLAHTQSDKMDALARKVDVLNARMLSNAGRTQSVMSSIFKGLAEGLGFQTTVQGSIAKYVGDVKSKFTELTNVSNTTSKSISGMWTTTATSTATAAGKTASTLLTLGKSLVSMTGVLGLGVNLLISFGEELFSAGEKAEKLSEATEEAAKFSKELGEAAGAEVSKLISLKAKVEDTTLAYDKRLEAARELQKLYPDYFNNLSNEEIMAGKVAGAYDKVTQAIIASAKARVLQTQLDKIIGEYIAAEDELKDIAKRNNIALQETKNEKTGLKTYGLAEKKVEVKKDVINGAQFAQQVGDGTKEMLNGELRNKINPNVEIERNIDKAKGLTKALSDKNLLISNLLDSISENSKNIPQSTRPQRSISGGSKSNSKGTITSTLKLSVPNNSDIETLPDELQEKKTDEDESPESKKLRAEYDAVKKREQAEEAEKQKREAAKEKRKQDMKERIEEYKNFAEEAIKAINAVYEAQLKTLDKEIELRKERVAKAEELAARGNTEMLRLEKEQLDKAQAEREKKARQQMQLNALLQASNQAVALSEAIGAIVAAAAKGDPYTIALRIAAAVAALVAGIASLSGAFSKANAFADGVVDFRGKGGPRDDANWVRISTGESVITAEGTRNNRALLEAINDGAKLPFINPALAYTMPVFANPQYNTQGYASATDLKTVESKLDGVINAIEDNRMKQNIFFNEQGVGIMTERAIRKDRKRWM
ncbi:hypothetical protein CAP35_12980 [Chitinophagaceae bacterium IBVUCB1]|nr:hypothetical protein CAP35_12980 [Chitinophagaceae bacterium IBVUCB1]